MATAGKCVICKGEESTDKKMRSHLLEHFSGGGASKAKAAKGAKAAKATAKDAFLVAITDDIPATYWLYVRVRKTATLRDVDDLIRRTWVECCGHMSLFRAGDVSYMVGDDDDGPNTKTMEENAAAVIGKSGHIFYEYDFGTTTGLVVKPAGMCSAAGMKRPAEVVARNGKLKLDCGTCGKAPAALVCTECVWGDQSPLLCRKCSKKHGHEDEPPDPSVYLPVVNSPRMGMCAYAG